MDLESQMISSWESKSFIFFRFFAGIINVFLLIHKRSSSVSIVKSLYSFCISSSSFLGCILTFMGSRHFAFGTYFSIKIYYNYISLLHWYKNKCIMLCTKSFFELKFIYVFSLLCQNKTLLWSPKTIVSLRTLHDVTKGPVGPFSYLWRIDGK